MSKCNMQAIIKKILKLYDKSSVSQELILKFEKKLHVNLPDDFKKILSYTSFAKCIGIGYYLNFLGDHTIDSITGNTMFYRKEERLSENYIILLIDNAYIILDTKYEEDRKNVLWVNFPDDTDFEAESENIIDSWNTFSDFFEWALSLEIVHRKGINAAPYEIEQIIETSQMQCKEFQFSNLDEFKDINLSGMTQLDLKIVTYDIDPGEYTIIFIDGDDRFHSHVFCSLAEAKKYIEDLKLLTGQTDIALE